LDSIKNVKIYSVSSGHSNDPRGGYAAILQYKGHEKEISGGYRATTQHRLDLFACIIGLKTLKYPCKVEVYSNWPYLIINMNNKRIHKVAAKEWQTSKGKLANTDLWKELLAQDEIHALHFSIYPSEFSVIRQRCRVLAQNALQKALPGDAIFEQSCYNNRLKLLAEETKNANKLYDVDDDYEQSSDIFDNYQDDEDRQERFEHWGDQVSSRSSGWSEGWS